MELKSVRRASTIVGALVVATQLASCGVGFLGSSDPAPGPETRTPPAAVPDAQRGAARPEVAARAGSQVAPRPVWRAELDAAGARWVDETLAGLDLDRLAGQLVIQWIPGGYASVSSEEFVEIADWVETWGLGGVSISIGLPHTYAAKLNELQARARVPLLVTADFENGGPGMRINHSYAIPSLLPQGGGTSFPPTMAFGAVGDPSYAYEYGRVTAVEARAVGVHLIFAPVLDVNSNPLNPIINTRSFGESPGAVARLGAAFIRGIHDGGAFATAKHFPGHGDTRTDSHMELPEVTADRARLDRVELVPFQRAIDVGVDAVMTAHVSVPGVLGPEAPPATLSPEFMTGLLRSEMGFEGVLFTDAMRMAAITDRYGAGEAAVLALEAGADVILAPADVPQAIVAVVDAVGAGRLSEDRLRRSVRKLLTLKARAGLNEHRLVDFGAVTRVVGSAEHLALADTVATRAITLVRDDRRLLPIDAEGGPSVLSVTYARPTAVVAGRTFDTELALRLGTVYARRVQDDTPGAVFDTLTAFADSVDLVLLHAYVPPSAGAGSVGAPPALRDFVAGLPEEVPLALVSLGNPYLLMDLPQVDAYLVAWGNHEVSQRGAIRALFGEEAISGRLPISIPPDYRIGDGLDRPRLFEGPRVAGRDPLADAGILPPRPQTPLPRGTDPPPDRPPPVMDTAAVRSPDTAVASPDTVGAVQADSAAAAAAPADTVAVVAAPVDTAAAPAVDSPIAGRAAMPVVRTPTVQPGQEWPAPRRMSARRNIPIHASPIEALAASAGMSEEILAELDSTLVMAIENRATPGAALAVGHNGRLVRLRGYGRLDWDPASDPVTPTSVYDLASLTKVVGTTTAVMILVERGAIGLDTPVIRYLPWWSAGDPSKRRVTIRQLLLHRAGLPPFRRFFLEMEGRASYRRAIGDLPLDYAPGDSTVYSDIGLMTLAFVIEEVTGQTLDGFLEQEVWSRLGMPDTGFLPTRLFDRIAPTEVDTVYRDGLVRGVVHDENAHAIGGVAGHAGLFSSARDLAVFAHALLANGTIGRCSPEPGSGVPCSAPRPDIVTLLNASTIRLFTRRHDESASRALGWDTPSGRSSAGDYFSARSFGHTGFTGTSIWMDPERDLFVVLLTNRVNPTRENSLHVPLRREVHNLAALAVTDRPLTPRQDRR